MKRLPLFAALVLLAGSLLGLVWALLASPRLFWGLGATVLLMLAFAALTVLAIRQRERIHSVKRALVRSQGRAQALVEGSPDGVAVLAGRIVIFANPAFRRLFAIPPHEDPAGRDMAGLISPSARERFNSWIEQRQSGIPEPERLEISGLRATGTEIPLEATAALLPAEQGRQMALFLRDLSARRLMEQRMRHLDRLETISAVGTNLVDEFGTIFQRIREKIVRFNPSAVQPTAGEVLEAVERLASRGASLGRRVRALASPITEERPRSPLDLVHLTRQVAAEMSRGAGDSTSIRVLSDGPERLVIAGTTPLLRQSLWQVLKNAREAQPKGEILVRTRVLELDGTRAMERPGSQPGPYAVVEVRDSGPGMTDEVRTRAFEPFFTTKGNRFPGMGLALVFGAVRSHGGFVELDSRPGEGTIVRMAFPRLREDALPATPAPPPTDPQQLFRGRELLLVVDDDPLVRTEARRLLEEFGYQVELAATPRIALERLRQRPQVDLVLLDMVLPGFNGVDFLRRILRHWPSQRVAMISPYPLPDQEDQALKSGALSVIRKPLGNPGLAREVRDALDRPPPAPM